MEKTKIDAREFTYRTIEEKILSGEFKSGGKITSETKIAQELGVSRMTVREAIEKMVALNILTRKQGGGTYVNDISPSVYLNSLIPMMLLEADNYIEILEFRLILEVQSAALCAQRADDETLEEIKYYYEKMIEYRDDHDKFTEADMMFHMKIAEGTKNSIIIKINSVLKNILDYHQKELYKTLGPRGGMMEHELIVNALLARDSELSSLYMRRHIERTIKEVSSTN